MWSEFCDWYLETAKLATGEREGAARATLYHVLESSLRLAHPMIPFVTEEIWQRLPKENDAPDSIMIAAWPQADESRIDEDAEREMAFLQEIVGEVRRFRHDHQIPPRERIEAMVKTDQRGADLLERLSEEIKALGLLSDIRAGEKPEGWSRALAGSMEIYLPLAEYIDLGAERERLDRGIADANKLADRARAKLDNPKFASGAPADVVAKVREQLAEHEARAERLRAQLEELSA